MEKAIKNNEKSLNYILNNEKPSKSTILKFKNENELLISEFTYFTVKKKGQKLNLISNKVIGIDGTFLKANTGINNQTSRKEIKLLEKTIQKLNFKNQKKFTSKRP